jgi:vitamin B12 transporter
MPIAQALPAPDPPATAIVVTGTALPDPVGERAYAVDQVDREDLINAASQRLDAILKSIPGVTLFRRSDSTSGHPTSQGVTLRALGGNASSRAMLMLDGVPQADPFGGWVNWPAYDPAGLDQVRIIRGGGSVAHGPGALAGVIEMSSRTAEAADAAIEFGSRGSLLGSGYLGTQAGKSLITINARGARSDGFVPITDATRGPIDRKSPYREASVRTRVVAQIGDSAELQLGGLAFVDVRERGLPFTGNRTRGADASARLIGSGNWDWSATGYAQWRNFRSSFASVDDERTVANRVALQDSVPSSALGGSIEVRPPFGSVELRIGLDGRLTSGESRELYSFAAGEPTRRRVAGGMTLNAGLFAEAAWTSDRLTLSGGARLDRWRISDGELVERLLSSGQPTRDDHYPNRGGWRPTARVAALFDAGGGFSLRSAAYLAWRLPTLNELFRPFRAGPDATAANPELRPERLSGFETGLRHRRGAIQMSLTAFANRLSDPIANVTFGQGPGTFPGVGFVAGAYRQRLNVAAVKVRGIEASGEARAGFWTLRAGASYTDAEVKAAGPAAALDGLRPAQTPDLVLTGGIGWEKGQQSVSLAVRHVGAQFEDDLNSEKLAPATTLDAFLGWPLGRRAQLILRGENLLNETVVAGIGDDGAIERGTPRTIWVGLRLLSW